MLTHAEIGDLLNRGKTLVEWYESLKEYALATCLDGGTVPGWKAVEGRGTRAWTDQDKALETLLSKGWAREVLYETLPLSLAQIEKLLGKKPFTEAVGEFVTSPPGKPTLAPESDRREPYNRAAADFAGVVVG